MPTKKKNPTDSTLRNVRAANTKILRLQLDVKKLSVVLSAIKAVTARVRALEKDVLALTRTTKGSK